MKIRACAKFLAVILLLVQNGNGYTCDPLACRPPNCQCATVSNPGGFASTNSPQFVVLSFDDAINDASQAVVQPLLDQLAAGPKDAAGCTPKTVFFFLIDLSDFHTVTTLAANDNIEIATHTVTHTTGDNTTLDIWRKEIMGCRNFTEKLCVVPKNKNNGFRFPFLIYNNEGFQVLKEDNYLYDSTLIEYWGSGSSANGSNYFPYTLDFGSPLNNDTGPIVSNFPGLWEIPMHDLIDQNGNSYSSMDPNGTSDVVLTMLKNNFNYHYNGNRAPFGIYLHSPWLSEDTTRTGMLVEFFKYAAAFPGVFFVTNQQIIEWSRIPTDIPATIARFKCPSTPPSFPNSTEICNGRDDNKNGLIDEGTMNNCSYSTGQPPFITCGLCPTTYPSLTLDFTTIPPCGNQNCSSGKTCVNCPQDCGVCPTANSTISATNTTQSTVSTRTTTSDTRPTNTNTGPVKIPNSARSTSIQIDVVIWASALSLLWNRSINFF